MGTCIAFLRAVNVAGHQPIAMAALRESLEKAGFAGAATVLQSGNVLLPKVSARPRELEKELEAMLERRLGLRTTLFVRTAEEWRRVIADNPFPKEAKGEPSHLLVYPLKEGLGTGAFGRLERAIVGREKAEVRGAEAYVYYPDGVGRSKVTLSLIERNLGTQATGRNWNTALKLAALAG